jgi:hypothetical protein
MTDLFSSAAPVIELHAAIDGKPPQNFVGRFAWTLNELIRAGDKGCTPIANRAPRWSHYVWRLRGDGVSIETINEGHQGAFSGTHARYRLCSSVQVLIRAGEARNAA